MISKFVVRLLDGADTLLAWAEVYAEAAPQREGASCPFWAKEPTQFLIEQDGLASKISIHWCDLDVARVQNLVEAVPVTTGTVCNFAWIEPVWLVPGMRDVPLPAVTVRATVTLAPATGSLSGAPA